MPKKGIARVKKVDKYFYGTDEDNFFIDSCSENEAVRDTRKSTTKKADLVTSDNRDIVDPAVARGQQKLSTAEQLKPTQSAGQPRQDSLTIKQSPLLTNSLAPDRIGSPPATAPAPQPKRPAVPASKTYKSRQTRRRQRTRATPPSRTSGRGAAATDAHLAPHPQGLNLDPANASPPSTQDTDEIPEDRDPDTMIPGGASIPPNQQRNMRACMICSIVRTQQQFMTQGCPNCEYIIELANNPDQINDCTSQVFEGLISVADTSRSWVARYQRLEGYVPGVYATQVEGILPEDVLLAVESAGINYVPRDGSEQEMLGKD
jgi:transcription elongation factor SPT4